VYLVCPRQSTLTLSPSAFQPVAEGAAEKAVPGVTAHTLVMAPTPVRSCPSSPTGTSPYPVPSIPGPPPLLGSAPSGVWTRRCSSGDPMALIDAGTAGPSTRVAPEVSPNSSDGASGGDGGAGTGNSVGLRSHSEPLETAPQAGPCLGDSRGSGTERGGLDVNDAPPGSITSLPQPEGVGAAMVGTYQQAGTITVGGAGGGSAWAVSGIPQAIVGHGSPRLAQRRHQLPSPDRALSAQRLRQALIVSAAGGVHVGEGAALGTASFVEASVPSQAAPLPPLTQPTAPIVDVTGSTKPTQAVACIDVGAGSSTGVVVGNSMGDVGRDGSSDSSSPRRRSCVHRIASRRIDASPSSSSDADLVLPHPSHPAGTPSCGQGAVASDQRRGSQSKAIDQRRGSQDLAKDQRRGSKPEGSGAAVLTFDTAGPSLWGRLLGGTVDYNNLESAFLISSVLVLISGMVRAACGGWGEGCGLCHPARQHRTSCGVCRPTRMLTTHTATQTPARWHLQFLTMLQSSPVTAPMWSRPSPCGQVFVSNGFPKGTTGYDFLTNIVSIVIIAATLAFVAFGTARPHAARPFSPPLPTPTPPARPFRGAWEAAVAGPESPGNGLRFMHNPRSRPPPCHVAWQCVWHAA
jgi:hypothetical protein